MSPLDRRSRRRSWRLRYSPVASPLHCSIRWDRRARSSAWNPPRWWRVAHRYRMRRDSSWLAKPLVLVAVIRMSPALPAPVVEVVTSPPCTVIRRLETYGASIGLRIGRRLHRATAHYDPVSLNEHVTGRSILEPRDLRRRLPPPDKRSKMR